MKNAIRSFIDRHGLAAAAIDAEKLLADFSSEMSAGLAGAALHGNHVNVAEDRHPTADVLLGAVDVNVDGQSGSLVALFRGFLQIPHIVADAGETRQTAFGHDLIDNLIHIALALRYEE